MHTVLMQFKTTCPMLTLQGKVAILQADGVGGLLISLPNPEPSHSQSQLSS